MRQSLIMSKGNFEIFSKGRLRASRDCGCGALSPFVGKFIKKMRPDKDAKTDGTLSIGAPTLAVVLALATAFTMTPQSAFAEAQFSKAVSVIVPYPPGGRTDLAARTLAQFLKDELRVAVAVVNKPGASGVLGANEVANAQPDGYTLGVFSTGFLTSLYTVPHRQTSKITSWWRCSISIPPRSQ